MLQAIRSKVGSWIVKILFAFLILSFAVWGIGDIFRGAGPDTVVAEVGEIDITVGDVDRAFDNQLRQLRRTLGPEIDAQAAMSLGLLDQALEQLVDTALVSQAAFDVGIAPSDALLADLVRQQEMFHDPETGRFSRARFEQALSQNRLTEAGYLQILRGEITQRLVTGAVAAAGQAPEILAEELLRFHREGRVAEVIQIDAAALASQVSDPTDSELATFHEVNASLFTAPEFRELSVIQFTAEDLANEIQLSEEDLVDEYYARGDLYQRGQPIRRFDQLLLAAGQQSLAAAVVARTREGLALEDAATAAGAEAAAVIPLDWTTQGEMLPALADVAFALPEGGVSDPIQSPFGWHILVVTDAADDGVLPLDAVRDEVEAAARLDRALDSLFEVANAFDDALAGGAGLEQAGTSLGLDILRIPPVSYAGEGRDGAPVPPVPALPSILNTAFGLAGGELSALEETEQRDGYYVVRVDRVIEPMLRPLPEIRDEVIARWRVDQQVRAAQEIAEAAAIRLEAGDGAAATAARLQAAHAAETAALHRDGSNRGDWPLALVDQLYVMAPGATAVVAGDDFVLAARLIEVVPAEPNADAIAEARRLIAVSLAEDLLAQFVAGLRDAYEVEIDRSALDILRGDS